MPKQSSNLVWMDLEFSGLDPARDVILEIATLVTDADLNILAEGPVIAIHQTDSILDGMDDWNKKHHGESGLIDRVRASSETYETAEKKILEFLSGYCGKKESPLCGNSIHQDRKYLEKYIPGLNAFFHYRNIDVSTVKELAKRWYPSLPQYDKKSAHRALDDIMESIEELRYFQSRIFRSPGEVA